MGGVACCFLESVELEQCCGGLHVCPKKRNKVQNKLGVVIKCIKKGKLLTRLQQLASVYDDFSRESKSFFSIILSLAVFTQEKKANRLLLKRITTLIYVQTHPHPPPPHRFSCCLMSEVCLRLGWSLTETRVHVWSPRMLKAFSSSEQNARYQH